MSSRASTPKTGQHKYTGTHREGDQHHCNHGTRRHIPSVLELLALRHGINIIAVTAPFAIASYPLGKLAFKGVSVRALAMASISKRAAPSVSATMSQAGVRPTTFLKPGANFTAAANSSASE